MSLSSCSPPVPIINLTSSHPHHALSFSPARFALSFFPFPRGEIAQSFRTVPKYLIRVQSNEVLSRYWASIGDDGRDKHVGDFLVRQYRQDGRRLGAAH